MKKFDDETLMAYVDSELGEAESRAIELALADNPQARSKIEEFRQTRAAINQFAKVLDQPVPENLIETIRRHGQPQIVQFPKPPRQRNWFLLAASLVVGVSLGSLGMKHILSRSHEDEVAILAKALDVMTAENTALAEKAMVAKTKVLPFPLSLVSKAIENGSKVAPDLQKTIVAELNTATARFTDKVDLSRPSSNASDVETLNDLQPGNISGKASLKASDAMPANNILGEFSYAGKTCRLFEYAPRRASKKLVLIACKKGAGVWKIVGKPKL